MDGFEVTPVILSAARTPTGRFGGSLSNIPAPQLGAYAIKAAVERAGIDPAMIDEVFMGQVVQAGSGQAPARQAAIYANLPDSVGAITLNKICGSGLRTVMMAATCIKASEGRLFVAGGMENMDMAPYMLAKARYGYRLGSWRTAGRYRLRWLNRPIPPTPYGHLGRMDRRKLRHHA